MVMGQCHGSVVSGQWSGVSGYGSVVTGQRLVSWVSVGSVSWVRVGGQCTGSVSGLRVKFFSVFFWKEQAFDMFFLQMFRN